MATNPSTCPAPRPRRRLTTVYEQYELIYSDSRKRISPIWIRPVDKSKFNITQTIFCEQTWNRVNHVYYQSTDLYKYSAKTVEAIVNEVTQDIKPVIKAENIKLDRDVKPKLESGTIFPDHDYCIKVEPKCELKLEPKTEIVNEVSTEFESDKVRRQLCFDLLEVRAHSTPRKDPDRPPLQESIQLSPLKRKPDTNETDDTIEELSPNKRRMSAESSYECYFQSEDIYQQDLASPSASVGECSNSSIVCSLDDSIDAFDTSGSEPLSIATPNDVGNNLSDNQDISADTQEPHNRPSSASSTHTDVYDPDEELRKELERQAEKDKIMKKIFRKVLSMLSLYQKLKFERVCKEWQSIIREQQTSLAIYQRKASEPLTYDWDTVSFHDIHVMNSVGVKLIEKFPNLTKIELVCKTPKPNISPIVEAINDKALDGLEKILFRGHISTDILSRFALLFGSRLKSIDINGGEVILSDIILKEKKLYGDNLESVAAHTRVNALTLNHLPSLREVTDLNIHSMDDLRLLAKHYGQQITKIAFREEHYLWGAQNVNRTLKIISKFKNLEYMEFYMTGVDGKAGPRHTLDAGFKPIPENCSKLKELHLFGSNAWFPLSRLQTLTNLKVLGLFFDLDKDQRLDYHVLTHLNLTEIWLYCDVTDDEMGDLLQQMPSVKTLHLKSNYHYARQVHDLIMLESSVTTLYVEDVNITDLTVGAAIIKARNHPKISYRLLSDHYEAYRSYAYDCTTLIRSDIPRNLTVIVGNDNPLLSTIDV